MKGLDIFLLGKMWHQDITNRGGIYTTYFKNFNITKNAISSMHVQINFLNTIFLKPYFGNFIVELKKNF